MISLPILILVCTLSAMVVSPGLTHPTGNQDIAAGSTEPNTLLGRQYQLAKRDPLIFMDPVLDSALDSTKSPSENKAPKPQARPFPTTASEAEPAEPKSNEPPPSQPPPSQQQPPPPPPSQNQNPNQNQNQDHPTTGGGGEKKPRRLVPYPRYLAERSFEHALEPRVQTQPERRTDTSPHTQSRSYEDEDLPEYPTPPPVEESFIDNGRKAAAKNAAYGAAAKPVGKSAGLPVIGSLGGGLPVVGSLSGPSGVPGLGLLGISPL